MSDRMTIRKLYFAWQAEDEERWLNQMVAGGWALCEVGFCKYTFQKCEPGEYTIRLQLAPNKNIDDYISFVEETGAEYIDRYFQWLFFRKKSELGEFELYSDLDSKIAGLSNLKVVIFILGLTNFINGFTHIVIKRGYGMSLATKLGWGLAIVLGVMGLYGAWRLHAKQQSLRKERKLRE